MSLKITPQNGCGAEITGVDLRKLTGGEMEAIRTAFADHGVLFFRDQELSERDHIAFAERWGDINLNRFFAAHPEFPQIAMVAKEPGQTDNIGGGWHTDHSYDVEPALGSILVARVLPATGGDTMFASMYAAYETLDDETRAQIDGLEAVHSARHIFGGSQDTYYNKTDAGGDRIGNAEVADTLDDVVHPVVITHPLSGRLALYVNPAFTISFKGQTRDESMPLMSRLFAHCYSGDFHTRLKWRPGTVAFWDNRATWHWALNDYHGKRRIMHRITVEGCALN